MSERPRPAPPTISIALNKTTVQSRTAPNPPDTLIVHARVADPDGIDSVWAQLGSEAAVGADGFFDEVLEGPFRLTVPRGLPNGIIVPVVVRARDVAGFRSEQDTTVQVGP